MHRLHVACKPPHSRGSQPFTTQTTASLLQDTVAQVRCTSVNVSLQPAGDFSQGEHPPKRGGAGGTRGGSVSSRHPPAAARLALLVRDDPTAARREAALQGLRGATSRVTRYLRRWPGSRPGHPTAMREGCLTNV